MSLGGEGECILLLVHFRSGGMIEKGATNAMVLIAAQSHDGFDFSAMFVAFIK